MNTNNKPKEICPKFGLRFKRKSPKQQYGKRSIAALTIIMLFFHALAIPQPAAAETNKINQDVTALPERDEINTINETLSAGNWHTVGLKRDGTVMAMGYNGNGQCNVSDWTNIVSVSGGEYHTVGLKSDGKVVAVGRNAENQCNVENWKNIKLPTKWN